MSKRVSGLPLVCMAAVSRIIFARAPRMCRELQVWALRRRFAILIWERQYPSMAALRKRLETEICDTIPNVKVNTPEQCAPHILNLSFGGVRSEVILHSLENEEIYVSSGSACSSHKREPSYVLTAIGTDRAMIDGSIRFSLSEFTTEGDIDATVAALQTIVPRLRKLK